MATIYVNNILPTSGNTVTVSGSTNVTGALNVTGSTRLGDSSADVVTCTSQLTASSGILVSADNEKVTVGAGKDLKLYHNATDSVIENATGHLRIDNQTNNRNIQLDLGTDTSATKVEIRNNAGATKWQIDGAGTISGSGNVTIGGTTTSTGIVSGAIAGEGSYVGVTTAGTLILTSSGGSVTAVSNGANDRLVSFSSATALNGEANLTFNGSLLTVAGQVSGSGDLNLGKNAYLYGNLNVTGNIDTAGDLTAATITMSGFTVDADGDTNLKSLRVDDGSFIGNDSDTDLMRLSTNSLQINGAVSGSGNGSFAGTLKAGNEGLSVDADGDTTVKSLISTSTVSGSGQLQGASLRIDTNGVIGTTGDTDLLTLANNQLNVAGAVSSSLALAGASLAVDGNVTGAVVSGSGTATLFGLNVGQSVFTVSNEGAVVGQNISGAVLSGSGTSTLFGLNVGQSVFTVSNEGAVVATTISGSGALSVGAGATLAGALNLQAGGITNAGAIAGATTISGSGNANVGGTVAAGNSGFTVDADGDTVAKSLSTGVVSGSATATLFGLNVGQGVFTVSNEGATVATTISGSGNANIGGSLNVGNSGLQVSSAGAVKLIDDTTLTFGSNDDWTIEYDEDGDDDLVLTGDKMSIESATAARPRLTIKNTTNDANSAVLRFVKDKGNAGATNDNVGIIEFYGDDASQDQVLFGRIRTRVAVHTNGQEGGKMQLAVASHDGELQPGLTIGDGDAEDEVDVTIGNGAACLVSSPGAISGSAGLAGLGLTLAANSQIGLTGDSDLISLSANKVSISGSLRPQGQIHITNHSYEKGNNADATWIPWVGNLVENTVAAAQYYNQGVMPCGGKLKAVYFRPENAQNGNVTISLYKNVDGNLSMSDSSTYVEEVTVSHANSAATATRYNMSGTSHFAEGNTVGIFIDPQATPGKVNITCIWELDWGNY